MILANIISPSSDSGFEDSGNEFTSKIVFRSSIAILNEQKERPPRNEEELFCQASTGKESSPSLDYIQLRRRPLLTHHSPLSIRRLSLQLLDEPRSSNCCAQQEASIEESIARKTQSTFSSNCRQAKTSAPKTPAFIPPNAPMVTMETPPRYLASTSLVSAVVAANASVTTQERCDWLPSQSLANQKTHHVTAGRNQAVNERGPSQPIKETRILDENHGQVSYDATVLVDFSKLKRAKNNQSAEFCGDTIRRGSVKQLVLNYAQKINNQKNEQPMQRSRVVRRPQVSTNRNASLHKLAIDAAPPVESTVTTVVLPLRRLPLAASARQPKIINNDIKSIVTNQYKSTTVSERLTQEIRSVAKEITKTFSKEFTDQETSTAKTKRIPSIQRSDVLILSSTENKLHNLNNKTCHERSQRFGGYLTEKKLNGCTHSHVQAMPPNENDQRKWRSVIELRLGRDILPPIAKNICYQQATRKI